MAGVRHHPQRVILEVPTESGKQVRVRLPPKAAPAEGRPRGSTEG
jgi:hypothetical protein